MTKSKSISSKKKNELTLNDTEQNTILATIYDGGIPHIVIKDTLKISLMSFYKYLDLNPNFKEEFLKAQEVGIKTLVEKMLAIFQSDTTEMSNEELLFLREKQNYIKWLAPRINPIKNIIHSGLYCSSNCCHSCLVFPNRIIVPPLLH